MRINALYDFIISTQKKNESQVQYGVHDQVHLVISETVCNLTCYITAMLKWP